MNNVETDIKGFLLNNNILTLATSDSTPWVCTLYYGMDNKFNLYLVTDPNSVHGQHISKSGNVAFSVFDSHTKVTENKRGIQGAGVCTKVTGIKEVMNGLLLWHKFNPGVEQRITLDMVKKVIDTKIFKIKPTYLKFFNKELYGAKEYGIITF